MLLMTGARGLNVDKRPCLYLQISQLHIRPDVLRLHDVSLVAETNQCCQGNELTRV